MVRRPRAAAPRRLGAVRAGAACRARRRDHGAPPRSAGGAASSAVAVRYVGDGEPYVVAAEVDRETESDTWWRATFPVANPATPYRWLLSGGAYGYAWLNGARRAGVRRPGRRRLRRVAGAGRARLALELGRVPGLPGPVRVRRARRRASRVGDPARAGTSCRRAAGPETPFEWFGGDLVGLEQRLDHIAELGANVLYLTPFFPAGSTHRYDATTFDEVDPLLGGDEALAALVRAAPARGDPRPRRPDDEPRRLRARVVHVRARRRRARARVLLLRPRAARRLRVLARRPLAPEAELRVRRSCASGCTRRDVGRPPLARAAVRARRLADRRREHDRPARRRRPPARRRAAARARAATRRARTRSSSPSTRTTLAPTSRPAAGTGR